MGMHEMLMMLTCYYYLVAMVNGDNFYSFLPVKWICAAGLRDNNHKDNLARTKMKLIDQNDRLREPELSYALFPKKSIICAPRAM